MNLKSKILLCALLTLAISTPAFAKHHKNKSDKDSGNGGGLDDVVVLIIRHGEKPDKGSGLSPAGVERANRYPAYFESYTIGSTPMRPDYLFAAAESKESRRPILTITPTSQALGLKIDTRFKDAQFADLANALRGTHYGKCILICWHHGEIPQLIQALGADPAKVIPDSKWPGSVFNWVIQLRFGDDGSLTDITRIQEPF